MESAGLLGSRGGWNLFSTKSKLSRSQLYAGFQFYKNRHFHRIFSYENGRIIHHKKRKNRVPVCHGLSALIRALKHIPIWQQQFHLIHSLQTNNINKHMLNSGSFWNLKRLNSESYQICPVLYRAESFKLSSSDRSFRAVVNEFSLQPSNPI